MLEEKKTIVYIGSDHAGFGAKDQLKDYLGGLGYDVTDLGCFSEEPCDYPDIGREIAEKVTEVPGSYGIAICGSGIGISIAVNKIRGIRGALCTSVEMAETARQHNNANVLALGARVNDLETLKKIAEKFLSTKRDKDERHVRRESKLNAM